MNYNIKINLLKLKDVVFSNVKIGEEKKQALVIPIKDNHFYIGNKGVYLNICAYENKEVRYNETHYLKIQIAREDWEKMTEEEKKKCEIIGIVSPMINNIIDTGIDFKKIEIIDEK